MRSEGGVCRHRRTSDILAEPETERKRIPGVELRHLHRHLRVARLRSSAAMAARALGLGQLRSSAVVR